MNVLKPGALGLAALAALAFPVVFDNPYYIHLVVVVAIYAILLFGLDVLVGYTGEVSLGHAGLFGIGAYVAGILATNLGWPIYLTLPAAMVCAAVFGGILAFSALRVTGPYLAMVTLAFGTIVQILINEMDFLTAGPMGLSIAKPVLFGHQLGAVDFYYFVIAMLALSFIAVSRLLSSHLGRAFEALRGSPIACDCMGVSVYFHKVFAFVVSAVFAGLAGALFAYSEEYIAPNGFGVDLAILFLLALILGGRKTRSGAILGAAIVVFLPNVLFDLPLFRSLTLVLTAIVALTVGASLLRGKLTIRQVAIPIAALLAFDIFVFSITDAIEHRLTVFGLMILGVVYYLPDGIMGWLRRLAEGAGLDLRRHRGSDVEDASEADAWGKSRESHAAGDELLQARGIVMAFGGLRALNRVNLTVRRGTIHGLIGPNGSGKSTMMNVLTGIYMPTEGDVTFEGAVISGRTPSDIARGGVARTFQNVQLFGEMTVLENVLVGLHHSFRSGASDAILHTPRYTRERQAALRRASGILHFVGLNEFANTEARNLPYGRQRMLEIGRALALDPSLILLDEPAAGLRQSDIAELMRIIRKIRDHGITMVLIEHHMDIVMSACDIVTFLDFGQKIAEGGGSAIRKDPKVVEAYLGGAVETPPGNPMTAPAA